MKRILFLLLVVLPSIAWADIDCKDFYQPNEPITFSVTAEGIPEGARIRGSVVVTNAEIRTATPDTDKLQTVVQNLSKAMITADGEIKTILGDSVATLNGLLSKQAYNVWAPVGKHTVTATGVWVLTRDVTIGDQTLPVLVDFGQYSFSKTFEVKAGDDPPLPPDPPDPPDPPTPTDQKWMVVFFYESSDTPKLPAAQQTLLSSLLVRQRLTAAGHKFLACLDKDRDLKYAKECFSDGTCRYLLVEDQWSDWWDAVVNDPMPRVAIAPLNGGYVQDFLLPANETELNKLLSTAKVLPGGR